MNAIYFILMIAANFLVAERVLPGRELPHSPYWYMRAVLLNLYQLGVILVVGIT